MVVESAMMLMPSASRLRFRGGILRWLTFEFTGAARLHRAASGGMMGWPSRRKGSLSDFQPRHDRKCSTGHFVFDVRDDLVVTNGIGLVKAYGHAGLAELQEPLLHRFS